MIEFIDAHPDPAITVRHYPHRPDVTDVFVAGWRVGTYKTATGVRNAIARETSPAVIADWATKSVARMDATFRADILSGRRVIGASPARRAAILAALQAA